MAAKKKRKSSKKRGIDPAFGKPKYSTLKRVVELEQNGRKFEVVISNPRRTLAGEDAVIKKLYPGAKWIASWAYRKPSPAGKYWEVIFRHDDGQVPNCQAQSK